MSRHLTRQLIAEHAAIRETPLQPTCVDRSFELPRGLYFATVALYLGFVGVMALGFATPGLAIPMTIFAFFIVAGFGIPAIWTRMQPNNPVRANTWEGFRRAGIATQTGWLSAPEAAAQMLVLPVLIFLWAIACVTIAALV